MTPDEFIRLTRRDFLTTTASGLGALALASILKDHGLLAAEATLANSTAENPLARRHPHFAPRAKACIFIFMEGAPSQMDVRSQTEAE
jgi:hypothetical protein